ncbi:Cilia- and flagella-associated protein 61 [Eumeta japonica]|uniref:Cilia-and flagella-associated protein 61 n=1 Tax=Eumeta variegata TaxID=151549 RepID=A0A4C1ZRV3_EUMVA|nr:Cilia- and flagella-associated protein 61 [Eumeta japonica]
MTSGVQLEDVNFLDFRALISSMVTRVASLPVLRGVRGARFDDAPDIYTMINETMKCVFDCEDIRDVRKLIETSVFALCLTDVCDRLVGFVAAKDHPLLPAMHPSAWEEFIWLRYKIMDMNSRNALFIHLLCWEPDYGRDAVDGLLRPLFMMDPHLMYVGFLKQPPDYPCSIRIPSLRNSLPFEAIHESTQILVSSYDVNSTLTDHVPSTGPDDSRTAQCLVNTAAAIHADASLTQVGERQMPNAEADCASLSLVPRSRLHFKPWNASERGLIPGQMPAEASFRRVNAMERGAPDARPPALYAASRAGVCPRLRVRRAVEEDNDDIIPIIERQSTRLRALYGEFYVSELVARHPESERVLLVCEDKQLAVGVMCLNTAINYDALQEDFDLMPYAGLKRVDKNEDLVVEEENEREIKMDLTQPTIGTESSCQLFLAEMIKHPKVSLVDDYDEDTAIRTTVPPSPALSWRSIQVDQLFDDDDDDVDFDIVNIDEALLTGSQMLPIDESPMLSAAKSAMPTPSFTNLLDQTEEEIEKSARLKDVSKPLKVVRYAGHPNAFLIELFAMHPDYDERHGFDMLEASFELFPGRDYCIVSLPTDHPTFPLLEHFTFVTPTCCKSRFKSDALYVAHINSVRGNMEVREAENYDLLNLGVLLEHTPSRSSLIELFRNSLESYSLRSFMFLSEKQPVGFAVVSVLDDGSSVRALYALDQRERVTDEDGAVRIFP